MKRDKGNAEITHGCLQTFCKAHKGYIFHFGSITFSWSSKEKQPFAAAFYFYFYFIIILFLGCTCEAEYVVAYLQVLLPINLV